MEPSAITRKQQVALCLAGTVSLPNPHPATGQLSICLDDCGEAKSDLSNHMLRLTEDLNERQVVTRFLRLGDVRAVRVHEPASIAGGLPAGEIKLAHELADHVGEVVAGLDGATPGSCHDLFGGKPVVLFVPESASVLMRLEFGVTAAEAAEGVEPLMVRMTSTCTCHP